MNYSQNKEQEVILEYFKDQPTGTFLDIGSNDGVTLSNVKAIADKGWCGCFLEPSPAAFHRLKKNYQHGKKGCFYFYNFAISTFNGPATFYDSGELLKQGDVSLVSTLKHEETKRFASVLSYTEIEVPCLTWKTFLNRSSIKKFDMLSCDVEGMEIEILEQMDLTDFKLLCIETNGSADKKAILDSMLIGFKHIYTSPENLIYVR